MYDTVCINLYKSLKNSSGDKDQPTIAIFFLKERKYLQLFKRWDATDGFFLL